MQLRLPGRKAKNCLLFFILLAFIQGHSLCHSFQATRDKTRSKTSIAKDKMPSLEIAYKSVSDSYFNTAVSTAATLGSLLWSAVARARGKPFAGQKFSLTPESSIEASMLRKPLEELTDNFSIARKLKKISALNSKGDTYNTEMLTIPQKIVSDSLPVVHNRLPDRTLWESIDENLLQQEVQIKKSSIRKQTSETGKTKVAGKGKTRASSFTPKSGIAHLFSRRFRRSVSSAVSPLQGVLRRMQLYCRTGFQIQLLPSGRVTGTEEDHNKYAILELISAGPGGFISIRGVESGRYLSMDSKGRLYGAEKITAESVFQENVEENMYNTYASAKHGNGAKTCYLNIGKHGEPRKGCKPNPNRIFTHFLPRPVDPEKVPSLYKGVLY